MEIFGIRFIGGEHKIREVKNSISIAPVNEKK